MDLRIEELGPLARTLRVEIPTAEVDAAFDAVYERLRRRAHLKGFRPGRAPRAVLERYFADEARGDVLDRLVRETLPKAVEDAALDLVAAPRLTPPGEAPRQGTPFTYEAQVELRPQIELTQVKGLAIPSPEPPRPVEEQVAEYLEHMRTEKGVLHPVEPGTPAADGHVCTFELRATREGEVLIENQERSVVLGEEERGVTFWRRLSLPTARKLLIGISNRAIL